MSYEKYVRDGKVAVLVSPGFGAGWSTWAHDIEHGQLAMDKRIVEGFIAHGPKGAELIAEELFPGVYLGGAAQLQLHWVPQGEAFEITEYDGSEGLRIIGEQSFLIA